MWAYIISNEKRDILIRKKLYFAKEHKRMEDVKERRKKKQRMCEADGHFVLPYPTTQSDKFSSSSTAALLSVGTRARALRLLTAASLAN